MLKIETKASTHALNSMELVNMKWNKAEATDTKIEEKAHACHTCCGEAVINLDLMLRPPQVRGYYDESETSVTRGV
jgi:hypothetical protein